ncbi:unnamed protein product [Boreogadus saida]
MTDMQHWHHALKDTEPSIDQAQRVKGFVPHGPSTRHRESKGLYLMVHRPGPESHRVCTSWSINQAQSQMGSTSMVHRPGPESQRVCTSWSIDQAQRVKEVLAYGPSTRPRESKGFYLNIDQAQRVKRFLPHHRPGPESQSVYTSWSINQAQSQRGSILWSIDQAQRVKEVLPYGPLTRHRESKGFLTHDPLARPNDSKGCHLIIDQAQRVKEFVPHHQGGPETQRVSTSPSTRPRDSKGF